MAKVSCGPAVAELRRSAGNMRFSKSRGGLVVASKHLELEGAAATDGARIYRSTDQVIPDTVDTPIEFDTVRYDQGGLANLTTFPTRLTVVHAGVYVLSAALALGFDAQTVFGFKFLLNTTTILAQDVRETSLALYSQFASATIWRFSASDYVEILIAQFSGVDATLFKSLSDSPEFAMQQLSS